MQITQITVRRSVKVNLGNFENTDFEIILVGGPDVSLSPKDMATTLYKQAGEMLRAELIHHNIKTDGYGLD